MGLNASIASERHLESIGKANNNNAMLMYGRCYECKAFRNANRASAALR